MEPTERPSGLPSVAPSLFPSTTSTITIFASGSSVNDEIIEVSYVNHDGELISLGARALQFTGQEFSFPSIPTVI